MLNSLFKYTKIYYITLISVFFFISIFFVPSIVDANVKIIQTEGEYPWPVPTCHTISCGFGKRTSPTKGASTYHKGIDIAGKPGEEFIAVMDGEITFAKFLGGGGYTLTLENNKEYEGKIVNIKITYCHIDPVYMVKLGDKVTKGQVIGKIGPKNVYGVAGNTYKDANGNPTNGATTGPHLHFGVRINGDYINPEILLSK